MKIAAIQLELSKDITKNIEKCKKFIDVAMENLPDLICFPELTFNHWFPDLIDNNNFSFAITLYSETIREFCNIAKKNKIVIILPFFEKDSETEGLYYNSATVIDKDGKIKGLYRKVHLPLIPNWEEKYYFTQGNLGFPVIDTSIGKIGLQIGWDVFFPEVSRILTLNGAEIIISPTCSAFSSQPRWLKTITANALSNTVFICRVNRVGQQGELDFYGGSFCAAPNGSLIAEPAGKSEGIVLWDINIKDLLEIRRLFPFLKDRVEKEYLEIIGKSYNNFLKKIEEDYDNS